MSCDTNGNAGGYEGGLVLLRTKETRPQADPTSAGYASPLPTSLTQGDHPRREERPNALRGAPSYFTSLGIQVPPSKEPLRARIWMVLTKMKEEKKETLVHSKNQTPPNLPLCFKITGPTEAAETEWTQDLARADLIQRLELELEENILRYKWSIREHLHLEWSWQEEKSRGGMDCTILAHIETEPVP
jgi:hypothetical protein